MDSNDSTTPNGQRPTGESLPALVDLIAGIDARRPAPGRFASEEDAQKFDSAKQKVQQIVVDQPSAEERRRHVRVPCLVDAKVLRGDEAHDAAIGDLGAGGVLVRTSLEPQVGDEVTLVIEPGEKALDDALQVPARVAWLGTPDNPGFGASFVMAGDDAEQAIDKLVLLLLQRRVTPSLP